MTHAEWYRGHSGKGREKGAVQDPGAWRKKLWIKNHLWASVSPLVQQPIPPSLQGCGVNDEGFVIMWRHGQHKDAIGSGFLQMGSEQVGGSSWDG